MRGSWVMPEVMNLTEDTTNRNITGNMVIKSDRPSMKQPTFGWLAKDKHMELNNFEMEVKTFYDYYL